MVQFEWFRADKSDAAQIIEKICSWCLLFKI